MKSFVQSNDFDFSDNITNGPFVLNWRREDGDVIIKPKSEYIQDDSERIKKNFKVLHILQCALVRRLKNFKKSSH